MLNENTGWTFRAKMNRRLELRRSSNGEKEYIRTHQNETSDEDSLFGNIKQAVSRYITGVIDPFKSRKHPKKATSTEAPEKAVHLDGLIH